MIPVIFVQGKHKLYMYIPIYMYICALFVNKYIYIYIYVYIYMYIYVCMYVYIYKKVVKDTSNLRSRETQTWETRTLSVQSYRECGTNIFICIFIYVYIREVYIYMYLCNFQIHRHAI
jgi:hypothetical protein